MPQALVEQLGAAWEGAAGEGEGGQHRGVAGRVAGADPRSLTSNSRRLEVIGPAC